MSPRYLLRPRRPFHAPAAGPNHSEMRLVPAGLGLSVALMIAIVAASLPSRADACSPGPRPPRLDECLCNATGADAILVATALEHFEYQVNEEVSVRWAPILEIAEVHVVEGRLDEAAAGGLLGQRLYAGEANVNLWRNETETYFLGVRLAREEGEEQGANGEDTNGNDPNESGNGEEPGDEDSGGGPSERPTFELLFTYEVLEDGEVGCYAKTDLFETGYSKVVLDLADLVDAAALGEEECRDLHMPDEIPVWNPDCPMMGCSTGPAAAGTSGARAGFVVLLLMFGVRGLAASSRASPSRRNRKRSSSPAGTTASDAGTTPSRFGTSTKPRASRALASCLLLLVPLFAAGCDDDCWPAGELELIPTESRLMAQPILASASTILGGEAIADSHGYVEVELRTGTPDTYTVALHSLTGTLQGAGEEMILAPTGRRRGDDEIETGLPVRDGDLLRFYFQLREPRRLGERLQREIPEGATLSLRLRLSLGEENNDCLEARSGSVSVADIPLEPVGSGPFDLKAMWLPTPAPVAAGAGEIEVNEASLELHLLPSEDVSVLDAHAQVSYLGMVHTELSSFPVPFEARLRGAAVAHHEALAAEVAGEMAVDILAGERLTLFTTNEPESSPAPFSQDEPVLIRGDLVGGTALVQAFVTYESDETAAGGGPLTAEIVVHVDLE